MYPLCFVCANLLNFAVCNYAKGSWVRDNRRPLYSGQGCKQWLSEMWACRLTQRTAFSYEGFKWQPDDCEMPDFDRHVFMKRLEFIALPDLICPDGMCTVKIILLLFPLIRIFLINSYSLILTGVRQNLGTWAVLSPLLFASYVIVWSVDNDQWHLD